VRKINFENEEKGIFHRVFSLSYAKTRIGKGEEGVFSHSLIE
jgi:hypothetical protein